MRTLIIAAFLFAAASAVAQESAPALLRARMDSLQASGKLSVAGTAIVGEHALPALYRMHDYQSFWNAEQRATLIALIEGEARDGLTPADYHLEALRRLQDSPEGSASASDADLIATDAFTLLLFHLYAGKVDPVSLYPHWNVEPHRVGEQQAVDFSFEALTQHRYVEAIARVRPTYWMYEAGLEALASYRKLAEQGGWPTVP